MAELLDFDVALGRLLALATPMAAETVAVADASGRYLAEDAVALLTQPPADVSAMDGYAIRYTDLPGPFRVIGESAAGRPLNHVLQPHEAARIFTGSYVPAGADTVAVQEDAVLEGGVLSFPASGPSRAGAHIRPRGQDFAAGERIAREGDLVSPARLGLLAAAGLGAVPVHRQPRIALISTGDELVPPGATPAEGQIIGSNGLMIAAHLRQAGAEVHDLGLFADRPEDIARAIDLARDADLIVSIGGASVGDHDLVKPGLEAAGASIDFWKAAIRPGKPLIAGRLGNAVVVGLPGNPVSAFVCARVFLWPLIRRMAGSSQPLDIADQAVAGVDLAANGGRRHFMRAHVAKGRVSPFPAQDSSLSSVLAAANAILVRPANAPAVPAGTSVPVLRI